MIDPIMIQTRELAAVDTSAFPYASVGGYGLLARRCTICQAQAVVIGTYRFSTRVLGCVAFVGFFANAIDTLLLVILAVSMGKVITHTDTYCVPDQLV